MKPAELSKYLFCYFTGNKPEEESVHLAPGHGSVLHITDNEYHALLRIYGI